jgi:CRP/FNR family transcriptional regulator/voltage-gated potassium channel
MRGDIIDAIREAPLFRDLTAAEIDEARASIELRRFADGEALMLQGAASDGAYVIVAGRVAVTARLPGGGETPVSELGAGDLLGEMALLLRGGKRSASARAAGPVEALFIDRRHFDASVHLLRPASLKLLRQLGLICAARLRSVHARVHDLVATSGAPALFRQWPRDDGAEAAAFNVRAFLPVLPPFREFGTDELDRLFDVADVEQYGRGATLQEAGEPARSCRLVVRGALLAGHRHGERLHQLDVLGPGRFAGVAALLEGATTSATVIAAEPSTVLRFDADTFRTLWSGEDRLALRLINAVNADVVQLTSTASNHLTRLTTQARVRELAGT